MSCMPGEYTGRRLTFKKAMAPLRAYEYTLSRALLDILAELPGAQVYGPTDPRRLEKRVATVSFTLQGHTPEQIASHLGQPRHLRLERQLLRPGRHHPPGTGRQGRSAARRRHPLQHPRGDRPTRCGPARTGSLISPNQQKGPACAGSFLVIKR